LSTISKAVSYCFELSDYAPHVSIWAILKAFLWLIVDGQGPSYLQSYAKKVQFVLQA
jgi:hypothetical protein